MVQCWFATAARISGEYLRSRLRTGNGQVPSRAQNCCPALLRSIDCYLCSCTAHEGVMNTAEIGKACWRRGHAAFCGLHLGENYTGCHIHCDAACDRSSWQGTHHNISQLAQRANDATQGQIIQPTCTCSPVLIER